MGRYFIVMGDVVASRDHPQRTLGLVLKSVLQRVIDTRPARWLSPPTVTLGDEFQGVAGSLLDAVSGIILINRALLDQAIHVTLRYVIVHGEIDTPINPVNAHQMLGSGLTQARELLNAKVKRIAPLTGGLALQTAQVAEQFSARRNALPVRVSLGHMDHPRAQAIELAFSASRDIAARWNARDHALIASMLDDPSNEQVGQLHDKTRDQIYRRRDTLMIEAYQAIEGLLVTTAEAGPWSAP